VLGRSKLNCVYSLLLHRLTNVRFTWAKYSEFIDDRSLSHFFGRCSNYYEGLAVALQWKIITRYDVTRGTISMVTDDVIWDMMAAAEADAKPRSRPSEAAEQLEVEIEEVGPVSQEIIDAARLDC